MLRLVTLLLATLILTFLFFFVNIKVIMATNAFCMQHKKHNRLVASTLYIVLSFVVPQQRRQAMLMPAAINLFTTKILLLSTYLLRKYYCCIAFPFIVSFCFHAKTTLNV